MGLIAYKTDKYNVVQMTEAQGNQQIRQDIAKASFVKEFRDTQSVVSYFSAHLYDSYAMADLMSQMSQMGKQKTTQAV